MIFINWIPEILFLILFFVTLISLNFKPLTYRSLPGLVSIFSAAVLIYFLGRRDLAHFESPLKILVTDSLSYFGRVFSVLLLSLGSLAIHLHRVMSYEEKQKSCLNLLFLCSFMAAGAMANSLLLYLISWMGCYVAVLNLILIESRIAQSWVNLIRQRSFVFTLVIALTFALYLVTVSNSESVYFSEYLVWVKQNLGETALLFVSGSFVLILGSTLVYGFVLRGKAPLGVAIANIFSFVLISLFWFRFGVPFLSESTLISPFRAQMFLGFILGGFVIRHAIQGFQTLEHDRWLSSVLPAVIGLGWFTVILGNENSLDSFYKLSLSFLITFLPVAHAFQERRHENKTLILTSIIALAGAPPLEIGFQFFSMIQNLFSAGLIPIAGVVALGWFGVTLAAVQMIGKIILTKGSANEPRKLQGGEIFFILIYFSAVTLLTVFRPELTILLKEHAAPFLW